MALVEREAPPAEGAGDAPSPAEAPPIGRPVHGPAVFAGLEPRALLRFAVPFVVLFGLTLAPWPYLSDTYTSAFDSIANFVLAATDAGGRVAFRFEPPERIRSAGSWQAVLRVDDRKLGQSARMHLDVRTFSYRPIATFAVAFVAAWLKGWRRNALVGGAGLLIVGAATSFLAVIAVLRFGVAKVLGYGAWQRWIETAYESLTTPAMVYAVPLALLWVLVRATTPKEKCSSGTLPSESARRTEGKRS